ncbi:MAG TPA: FHA domain-containing protein [Polyangiaceae bacterium]|jgi:hypothetical protein
MSVFDRLFGKGGEVRNAKRAELRGELDKAAELYGIAGAPEEAARVMILRGDAETDARARMKHYTQAVATAPEGSTVRDDARKKRAGLLVAQFGGTALSESARRELRGAAGELLAVGDATNAAEAYKLAGDSEGQAKALAQAGDVDSLEQLLSEQQKKERQERERQNVHGDVEVLASSGRRREALAAAEKWLAAHDDASLRDRAAMLKARRVLGPVVRVRIRGKDTSIALGDDLVIGRTEGTLHVPSQAVSRQHLRLAREGGTIVVRDLGSRNGTQLRGMNLVGVVPIPDSGALELTLGKEVHVRIERSTILDDAIAIDLGSSTYVAPLGRARVPDLSWELCAGDGGWVELACDGAPPYAGDVRLGERVTLLAGDVLASERGGPEILRVLGSE